MPIRAMSFYHTQAAIAQRRKTVTRTARWAMLEPGELLRAVKRSRGIAKADREELALIEVVDVRTELLGDITDSDIVLEGLKDWTKQEFIDWFINLNSVIGIPMTAQAPVRRIEFKYVKAVDE